jgi:hypothetical protein
MYVEDRALLLHRRSLVIRIGTAPDGLPRVLSINRGTPPEALLKPVAHALGVDKQASKWTGSLRSLAEQVRSLVDSRQFIKLTNDDARESTYYLSWSSVKTLYGSTLFEDFVKPPNMRSAGSDPFAAPPEETFSDTRTMVMGDVQEARMVLQENSSGPKLAIEVDGPHVGIAHIERHPDGEKTFYQRPFLEENLESLSSARFCARSSNGSVIEGSLGTEYIETRRQLASHQVQWFLTAEKRELIYLCSKLARSLGQYHDKGLIHCDIKPANLLLLSEGLKPIDSLKVSAGQRSPGLSPDFAAPEQILGDPISPQTDQYALGILLSRIVDGLLYGEEARYHIPVSRTRLEVFKLLKNPGVFLAPQTLNASPKALTDLRRLIQRCLMFEPKERHGSMGELADELDAVLQQHELSGFIESELTYGTLTQIEDVGFCWLLEDVHP